MGEHEILDEWIGVFTGGYDQDQGGVTGPQHALALFAPQGAQLGA